jgi:outer membrane protein with beta-barrel domain
MFLRRAALLVLLVAVPAAAQSESPRGTVGILLTATGTPGDGAHDAVAGFGARFGFDPNRIVGFDAEVNYYPGPKTSEGLFGVRLGRRSDRVGVYAKLRPGYMRTGLAFDPTVYCVDVGGVVEVYTTKRIVLRFDAGDIIVDKVSGGGVYHRFQASAGVGFRF